MAKTNAYRENIPAYLLQGNLWRMVESQEQIATHSLVESLAQQAVLEQLLDQSKPDYPDSINKKHYLLSTPFRYPPLPWGSRFGQKSEHGIFYASQTIKTALAEVAYYRFVFFQGMSIPYTQAIVTQHTAFSADYICRKGADLFKTPFDQHQLEITAPNSYQYTQTLGTDLRAQQFDGLIYPSARCPDIGINVALFTANSLKSSKPKEQTAWVCELTSQQVSFNNPHLSSSLIKFNMTDFEVNGHFPAILEKSVEH